ncbi:MAG: SH3 domain-containing protein [Spirochaetaceae bacterium]|nr:SH3 domain-containing protein [Spirochaetaceae bacterium]
MTLRRAFGTFGGGVAIALALVSCGERSLGTGVVLWSEGGPVATGAIVDVVEESTIEDRYLVRAAAADRREEPLPVAPRWRVRVFAEPEQAAEFAARFAEFVDVYAYAVRRGLPVRAQASATAGIVYKLREQEVIKVIARGAEPEQVGSFENYWYGVLTEDGTEGYTFGEFLPVFESFGDPHAEAARLQADDPGLERALRTAWRPEEFLSMVNRRRFDLLRLRPEYGLFPDPEAGVFRLVTAQREREFPYRAVERVGDGRYVLATEGGGGSPARFTLRGNGALAFSYVDEGRLVTEVFVDLQQEVEELIAGERGRRERLFAALLERGPLLRSGGYGTIELTEEGRFRWQGYEALVPRWVADGLPGTGVVDFRYALGAPLRGAYDTVVTLLFDARPPPAGTRGAAGAVSAGPATAAAGTHDTTGTGSAAVLGAGGATPAGAGAADAGAGTGGARAGPADTGPDAADTRGVGTGTAAALGGETGAAGVAPAGTGSGTDAGGAGAGQSGRGAAGTEAGAGAGGEHAGPADGGAGTADTRGADTGAAAAPGGETGAPDGAAAGTGAGDAGTDTPGMYAAGTDAAGADAAGADAAGATAALAPVVAGEDPGDEGGREPGVPEPEYMRATAWAAELTLLVSYDGAGVRLTPAEPAAAALEVRQVNRSAVVMYFASSSADGG